MTVLLTVPLPDYFLSDHCSLLCDLTVGKPTLPTKSISYREFKAIDLQVLCDEMTATKLCHNSPNTHAERPYGMLQLNSGFSH